MEPQQTVTVILVLVLNVIAWIAGYSSGHSKGISTAVKDLARRMKEYGFDVFQIAEIMEGMSELSDKQKTPTDEQG